MHAGIRLHHPQATRACAGAVILEQGGRYDDIRSPPRKGVINKTLKRHGSDATEAYARNLMEAFGQMQERNKAATEEEPELATQEDRELIAEMDFAEGGQSLAWRASAWGAIERKHYTQTTQIERMFGLQTQRRDSLEARLKAEVTKCRAAMQAQGRPTRGDPNWAWTPTARTTIWRA